MGYAQLTSICRNKLGEQPCVSAVHAVHGAHPELQILCLVAKAVRLSLLYACASCSQFVPNSSPLNTLTDTFDWCCDSGAADVPDRRCVE